MDDHYDEICAYNASLDPATAKASDYVYVPVLPDGRRPGAKQSGIAARLNAARLRREWASEAAAARIASAPGEGAQ